MIEIHKTAKGPPEAKTAAPDPDAVVRAIANFESEVLNSDEVFVVEEILSHLIGLIPSDLEFDFLLRERPRFRDAGAGTDPAWLYFQYLSFSVSAGVLKQFSTPNDVEHL